MEHLMTIVPSASGSVCATPVNGLEVYHPMDNSCRPQEYRPQEDLGTVALCLFGLLATLAVPCLAPLVQVVTMLAALAPASRLIEHYRAVGLRRITERKRKE